MFQLNIIFSEDANSLQKRNYFVTTIIHRLQQNMQDFSCLEENENRGHNIIGSSQRKSAVVYSKCGKTVVTFNNMSFN